jgi:hypothetical protein
MYVVGFLDLIALCIWFAVSMMTNVFELFKT